jgi:hypothetical protein
VPPPAFVATSALVGEDETGELQQQQQQHHENGEALMMSSDFVVGSNPSYEPTEEEVFFIEELRAAERRLRNGYVGANYFVTRWQSSRLDPSPDARRRMLEHLVTTGLIEVYHALDGNAALRARWAERPPQ